MEAFLDIIKIVLPAGLVLYAVYLIVRSFIGKELEKIKLEVRGKSIETVLPNRLQAYERMVLFLERMNPSNLLVRLNTSNYSARELQELLLMEIRNEYNHNVSQQVYMSEESWDLVKTAKEDLIKTINESISSIDDKATATDLSRLIIEKTASKDPDPIQHALMFIKNEIRQTF